MSCEIPVMTLKSGIYHYKNHSQNLQPDQSSPNASSPLPGKYTWSNF